jgi:UPF0271 protein
MIKIDLNCDMGESYFDRKIGNDESIMPYVSSCNIACGQHGGDKETILSTLKLAKLNNVSVGAHPSYPDLEGFGRRPMQIEPSTLYKLIKDQLIYLSTLTHQLQIEISHVKPHGALYNTIVHDVEQCQATLHAIKDFDDSISVVGMASSLVQDQASKMGLKFLNEAFADRAYMEDGKLAPRSMKNAVHTDTTTVVNQFKSIVLNNSVATISGTILPVKADTICIHGDNDYALEFVRAIKSCALEYNISIASWKN